MKENLFKLTLLIIALFAGEMVWAGDYYVSTSGNDNNNGSQESPWKTIEKAFSSVPANGGHVINIGAGTFASTSNKVPSGVTVNGAGENSTIISSSASWVLDISGVKNVTIQNLKFDGTGQPNGGGLLRANNGSDYLKILNVNFSNGNGVALNVSYSNNVIVDKGYYKEAGGRGNDIGDVAVVAIGPVTNGIFKNLTIEDTEAQSFRGWGTLKNVVITNNVFKGTLTSSWAGGSGGALGLELWGVENVENVEIAYNYSRGAISLASGPGHGNKSVRVHHNEITGNYGIEMTMDNITADHNFIHDCGYAFGGFGSADETYTGWNVHHNVCFNTGFSIFFHILSVMTNSKVYNNTVYNSWEETGPSPRFNYWGGGISNVEFANNILISTYSYPFDNGGQPTSYNLFRFTSPVGSAYVTGDPMFVNINSNDVTGFAIQPGSPAIDKGVLIPGITDNVTDGKPDIGAFEKDETWTVGPLSANAPSSRGLVNITSPVNGDVINASTIIPISAEAFCEKDIVKVEFYQGDTKLGEATAAPYSINWSNAPKGTFMLKVIATDSEGTRFESNVIIISVTGIAAKIATIEVTDNYNSTATVTINAEATANSGSIKKVEFYNGTTLLGEKTNYPYKFIWSNVAAGQYNVKIKTTDNENLSLESSETSVTVNRSMEFLETNEAPKIDGLKDNKYKGLMDSIKLPLIGQLSSSSDLSARFTGLYDSKNLYVFIEVTDDVKNNDSGSAYWDDDNIEFMIDADNSKNTSYDENDFLYYFTWNTPEVHEERGKSTAGIEFKMLATNNGYNLEAKIPWTTIGVKPTNGLIGLEIEIDDDDDGGERDRQQRWNATSGDAWENPSLLGNIKLKKASFPNDIKHKIRIRKDVKIYPNPSCGVFYIEVNDLEYVNYTIIDTYGKIIQKGTINENIEKIDLSTYKGLFFIKLENNHDFCVKKIIVR